MIKVEGKALRLDDVDKQYLRTKLKNAFADVLAEEGIDIEQVELKECEFSEHGKYEISLQSK